MRIVRPISNDSLITQLPRYAYPLSILLLNKTRNLSYLLNDFYHICGSSENGLLHNATYDWMYINHGALKYECGVFPVDLIEESTSVINFILGMLLNGRYCIVDLDEYYCRISKKYCLEHNVNGYLVHGIDTDTNKIYLFCVIDGKHVETTIGIKEFIKAIYISSSRFVVHCIKESQEMPAPCFDKQSFLAAIQTINAPQSKQSVIDLLDCDALYNFVCKLNSTEIVCPQWLVNSALSLSEYHTIMATRLFWLNQYGEIAYNLPSQYEHIRSLAKDIYMLSLHYKRVYEANNMGTISNAAQLRDKYMKRILEIIGKKILQICEEQKNFFNLTKKS